jgi:hypothetical protein
MDAPGAALSSNDWATFAGLRRGLFSHCNAGPPSPLANVFF